MATTSSPLEATLQRSRVKVTTAVYGLYLLYTALTTLLEPVTLAHAWQAHAPRYLAAAVVAALLLIVQRFPRLVQAAFVPLSGVLILICANELWRVATTPGGVFPFHLGLWLTVNSALTFMVLGTRLGLGILSLCVLVLGLTLLAYCPSDTNLVIDWVTLILVNVASGVASYALMKIIELNLLAHAQTTAELQAARLDPLTGLPGRAAIEQELACALARTTVHPISVAMCDVDHFKRINDRYGHARGDEVLRDLAVILRQELHPSGGIVGRWGGEEFMIVWHHCGAQQAEACAEALRRTIEATPLAGLNLTVSIGVATTQASAAAKSVFSETDAALYRAKNGGRNAVHLSLLATD